MADSTVLWQEGRSGVVKSSPWSRRRIRCLQQRSYRRLVGRLRQGFRKVLSGWGANRRSPVLYTSTWLREVIPAEQLQRAQLAAHLGVGRLPQRPGLWLRTTGNGDQRLYRVSHHNGQLYATVGRLLPVAVPTTALPGYWHPVR